jgi:glycerol-3-phosphate dehydrogenase (NAD(P)+)
VQGHNRLRVLILGYGEMGHAMQALLAPRHTLQVWQRHPPPGRTGIELAQAVPESQFVLFCLPATAHAGIAGRIAPLLRGDTLCLTIAKGLDDAGRTPFEALAAAGIAERVTVLYGPMIAEEIQAGKPAFAQCGAADETRARRVMELFAGSALQLEFSPDVPGLTWSAILKNVYAIAFGVTDQLALGDNARGFLAVAVLHELESIVRALGGAPATPFHLAGLGDLITTATSSGSHHHELGRRLARGERDLSGEGVHTLSVLRAHPRIDPRRYPLFRLIDACVQDPASTRTLFPGYLTTRH